MKNKIIYSIIICFWALVNSLSAQSIGLRFPDTTMVQGDTIMLPLYVDSTLTGEEVYSFNLEVSYPSNYFDFVEVSTSDMTASFGELIVNSKEDGEVLISGASGTALSGTGMLLHVHLKAIKTYSYGQWVEVLSSSVFNEGLPAINVTKGKVRITEAPQIKITPNTADLLVGETLELSVSGDTIGPFVYEVLESAIGSVDDDGVFTALALGSTKVMVRDANNVVDETDEDINVFGFSLSSPDDLSQWQGGQIDVPVIVHNTAGSELISGSFKFEYSNSVLSFKECIDSATLLENAFVECVELDGNKLMLNFANAQPLGDDSVLVYLRFDVSRTSTGTSNFDYSDIVFNEDLLGLNRKGKFITINYQTVYFQSSKYTLIAGDTCPMTVSGGIHPYTFSSNNEAAATITDAAEVLALRGGKVNFTATDSVGSMRESNEFTIYDTYVEIPDTTAPLLSDYLLPVYIGDLPSGTSVSAFQMEISFKQPELEFISVVSDSSLSEGWALAHSLEGDKLLVSGAGTYELTEKGVLFYVKYQLTEDFTLNENVSVSIDNVLLNEGSPTALQRDGNIQCVKREDLMIYQLLSPLSGCNLSSEEQIVVEIRNNGFLDYEKGETVIVSYTIDEGVEVIDTIVLSNTFPMKSELQYTFSTTVDMLEKREYSLEVKTKLSPEFDANPDNDVLSQAITHNNGPTANFSYTNEGLRVSFTNLSTSAEDYRWYFGDGSSSKVVNPVHTYEWRDNNDFNLKSASVDSPELFSYYVRLVSSNGFCEDVWLDTIPSSAFLASSITHSMCEGEIYEFGDEVLTQSGTYYHNFQSPTGKDSIVQLSLKVDPKYNDTLELDICSYEVYDFAGQLLTEPGEYTNVSQSKSGCDSISTLILGVLPNFDDSVSITITDGSYYIFGLDTLWTAGIYTMDVDQLPVSAPIPCMRTVLTLSVEPASNIRDVLVEPVVNVYPNPVKDVVRFNTNLEMASITLYNSIGLEVYRTGVKGKQVDLYLSGICSPGIYISRVVMQNNQESVIKILIE